MSVKIALCIEIEDKLNDLTASPYIKHLEKLPSTNSTKLLKLGG